MRRILLFAVAAIGLATPSTAHAWTSNHFYSQSANIECKYYGIVPDLGCMRFRDHRLLMIGVTGPATSVVARPATYGMSHWGSGYTLYPGQNYRTYTASGAVQFRCFMWGEGLGVECWSKHSGHGFQLSATKVTRF